jgi:hypothetical protein
MKYSLVKSGKRWPKMAKAGKRWQKMAKANIGSYCLTVLRIVTKFLFCYGR